MKILLTGNLFFDYEYDIRDALIEMGHEVDLLFNNIHGPYSWRDPKTLPEFVKYGVMPHKLKIHYFWNKSIERYNAEVQRRIKTKQYDMMLVVGAKTIFQETIALFKGPKVLWFMDGLQRYQYVLPKVPMFDHIFLFEWTDVPLVKEQFDRESTFLTLGFNPRRYFPTRMQPKYDFSLVGAFYPKREEYLHALLDVSDNMGLCGDFYRSQYKEIRDKVLKITVPYTFANQLYNQTKVNMNIHHPQSKEGLSVRTFEIMGAGGFELVERQRAAVKYFKEDVEIGLYGSLEECLDKARFYLSNDQARQKVAEAGHQIALKEHTWKARLQELFQISQLG